LVSHKTIKTSAVFAQFKHVTRDSGIRQGYFNGYFIENGWMWFIPLHSDIMSVGVVMNKPGADWWSQKSPEEILFTYVNRYKFIKERFENAEQLSKVRMLRGLPYTSKRSAGDGWLLVGDANFFVDPLYSSGVHIAFDSAEKAADAIAAFLQCQRDFKPLKRYEQWGKKYQFHVFGTINILYKMLKDRVAMETYIKLSGKYGNHWDNPILRRVNAWGTGHFDKFYWALYSTWLFSALLIGIANLRKKLGIAGWDTHSEFCTEPQLIIPKSAEFLERESTKDSNSSLPASNVNYQEHWIAPTDLSTQTNSSVDLAVSEPNFS
jgi:hypothetical protein